MREIIDRVAKWNAQRYEQKFDHSLATVLLQEEYSEWLEADNAVDSLDALCDIIYVSFGVLWKLDTTTIEHYECNANVIPAVNALLSLGFCEPAYHIGSALDVFEYEEADYTMVCTVIVYLALAQMQTLGLSPAQSLEALHIVCDANDSKSVTKTASNLKANITKGANYQKPEPRLAALLKKVTH